MNDIRDRSAGPTLGQTERSQGDGKRWAILLGFAACAALAVFSVNHRNDTPATPSPATAAAPAPVATPPAAPRQGG